MISLPIYWTKGVRSPSTTLVSMNWYRNANYFDQSKFKRDFHELVINQLSGISPVTTTYVMHYNIYYKNPSCDGANIVALIEKVVLDSLQQARILTSDTVKHHLGSTWTIAGQDKLNPRVEVTISSTKDTHE